MRKMDALVLFLSLICVACGNIIKHFDLLNRADSKSYCDSEWRVLCEVPADEEVRISFHLIITTQQTSLKFQGVLEKLGTTEYLATVLFKNYHACLSDDEVVLQPKECRQDDKIPAGTYSVHLDIVLSKTADFWPWFTITDSTDMFYSGTKQVTVAKK